MPLRLLIFPQGVGDDIDGEHCCAFEPLAAAMREEALRKRQDGPNRNGNGLPPSRTCQQTENGENSFQTQDTLRREEDR
jgi:hypothetical protein